MKFAVIGLLALFASTQLVQAQQSPKTVREIKLVNKQQWMTAVSGKIRRFTRLPKPIEGISGLYTATLQFVVHRDGRISDIQLKKSSGVPQVDENARSALERAAQVAPFTPDMTGETTVVVVPIGMQMVLPLVVSTDEVTGLRFTVPRELRVIGKMEPPGADTVRYRLGADGPSRIAAASGADLCVVGFRERPAGQPQGDVSQAKLNEDGAFQGLVSSLRASAEADGKTVHEVQTRDMKGARAVEMVLAPASGAGDGDLLQYDMAAETTAGRITVSCTASRALMPEARDTFRRLAESVHISR